MNTLNTATEFHELVLKLRLAYSTDTDFIEVELNKCELTYASLLDLCCTELGLNCKYVERLRKLPNTWLRKDKDVQRLKDFEVLLSIIFYLLYNTILMSVYHFVGN